MEETRLSHLTPCLAAGVAADCTLCCLCAVLISMSLGLQSLGVIDAFSGYAGSQLDALGLPWPALFAALHLTYFLAHYMFASQTAHVGALFAAFCSLMISSGGHRWPASCVLNSCCSWAVPVLIAVLRCAVAGVPPQLAAMSLAFNVNLFGSLTHYASGQAAVYYGSGFLKTKDVFVQGAACAVMSLLLWGSVGMLWWRFLGWY
jgi:DASS family divalent anion:Na+ symporter